MTSQNENKAELVNEAKELGIKGAHLMGVETLEKRIAEAKEEPVKEETPVAAKPLRKKAPSIKVAGLTTQTRQQLIERLEREDPESKYVLQPSAMTGDKLAAKGLEATGETIGNEIVCRTSMESYAGMMKARNVQQREMMNAIDPAEERIKSFDASPAKGR